MTVFNPKIKRIAVDILGVLAIIAAAITAPIPGPGGLPLLIIGLSLLATNHEWAERLLNKVKLEGMSLTKRIFSDHPRTRLIVDVLSIAFITGAVLLVTEFTRSIAKTAALSLVIVGLTLFFGNRERWQTLKKKFTRG